MTDRPIADIRDPGGRKPLPPAMIREMRPADHEMIVSTYLSSASAAYAYRDMPRETWDHFGAIQLKAMIERSQVLVAYPLGDPGGILGYAVAERPFPSLDDVLLHWLYVKWAYRRQGLGAEILRKGYGYNPEKCQLICTHRTQSWHMADHRFGGHYNPFFLNPEYLKTKEPTE